MSATSGIEGNPNLSGYELLVHGSWGGGVSNSTLAGLESNRGSTQSGHRESAQAQPNGAIYSLEHRPVGHREQEGAQPMVGIESPFMLNPGWVGYPWTELDLPLTCLVLRDIYTNT